MFTSFISMPKTWANVLTKPNEQTFAAERSRSSVTLSAALTWVVLVSAVAILLSIQRTTLTEEWMLYGYVQDWYPPDFIARILQTLGEIRIFLTLLHLEIMKLYGWLWFRSGLFELIGEPVSIAGYYFLFDIPDWLRVMVKIILSPVFFLIKVGAYHCIATLFGGRGQFGRYAYLIAAFGVPIAILRIPISFLPLAGGRLVAILSDSSLMVDQDWYYALLSPTAIIATFVTVYWLVLFYFTTKVEHEMPRGRAIIVTVVSYLIGFMLSTIPTYTLLGLMEAGRLSQG